MQMLSVSTYMNEILPSAGSNFEVCMAFEAIVLCFWHVRFV